MESAKKYGIRIIHQELMLISYMTIAENIFLGQEPRTRLGTVDTDKMNSETAKFLAEMELSLKPTDLVGKTEYCTAADDRDYKGLFPWSQDYCHG